LLDRTGHIGEDGRAAGGWESLRRPKGIGSAHDVCLRSVVPSERL
jgi:hypothetical protein